MCALRLHVCQEACSTDRCFLGDPPLAPGSFEALVGHINALGSLHLDLRSSCVQCSHVWLSEAASCTRLVLPEIPVADSAHHNASPNPPVEWFIDDSSGYLDLVTSDELETDAEGSPGAWLHGGDAERFAQVQMTWKFFLILTDTLHVFFSVQLC